MGIIATSHFKLQTARLPLLRTCFARPSAWMVLSVSFAPQAEVGGPLGPAVETELEFVRAEGCDEGFSGEVIERARTFGGVAGRTGTGLSQREDGRHDEA